MARLIRVHASADEAALARITERLVAAGVRVLAVHRFPGELVGDAVEVSVDDVEGPEQESTVRGLILEALPDPRRQATPAELILERLDRIEGLLLGLCTDEARSGPVHGPAAHKSATGRP